MTNINKLIEEILDKLYSRQININNGLTILSEQIIDESSKTKMKKVFLDELEKIENSLNIFLKLKTQFKDYE